jgi:hypothetical protein
VGGLSEVREIEVRKVGMKEVRVKADTVRADQVRAERAIKVRAIKVRAIKVRAIKVRRMFKFHHRQVQLKYLEALGMFDYQEIANPGFVVVITVAYVY